MIEKLLPPTQNSPIRKISLKQYDYLNESYLSRLFFYWAYKIINMSQKIPIKVDYLGKLHTQYSSKYFFKEIYNIWETKGYKKKKYKPLLFTVLRTNLFSIIFIFISTLINSCLNILALYIFRIIIQLFIIKKPVNVNDIYLVSFYLIIRLIDFMFQRKIAEILRNIGNKSSVELNCLIYNKLLKLSPYVDIKSGQIYNFIQSDSLKLAKLIGVSPNLLSIPFLILMYNYLLFKYLGIAFIFGFIVMIIFFIVNFYYRKQYSLYLKLHIKKSDLRMKITTETFNNLKVIKLYGWDDIFLNRIEKSRKEEIDALNKRYIITQISQTLLWLAPIAMSVSSIGAYQFLNETFKIEDIFTCIGVFTSIQNPMKNLPVTIDLILEAFVSLERIEKFLSEPEINYDNIMYDDKFSKEQGIAIKIENGTFSWGEKRLKPIRSSLKNNEKTNKIYKSIELSDIQKEKKSILKTNTYENKPLFEKDIIKDKNYVAATPLEQLILRNINLEVKKGEFVCIIGEVGSGKSSLIHAILNNMICLTPRSSKIILNGKVSYVSQESWIQNTTIKDNILFNSEYLFEKYDKIIELCELKHDLNILEGGDLTEIGEKGVNLSGGQKTRIALARAMYSNGDIFILDDPISSLDANTGKKIMMNCIIDYLKDKTRVLVTHALQYTKYSDRIIYMKNGEIKWEGIYSELIKQQFYETILTEVKNELHENEKDSKIIMMNTHSDSDTKSISSSDNKFKHIKRLTKDEKKEEGKIDKKVFFTYFKYIGGIFLQIKLILTLIIWQTLKVGSDIWLGYWSENQNKNTNTKNFLFYSFLALGSSIFNYIRTYIITTGSLKCSIRLHKEMITNLIYAPINLFHDTIPKGQIFNRLSKDLPTVDSFTMYWFMTFTSFGSSFLGAVIICSIYQPYCLFFVPFFISTCLYLSRFYMNCSRELSRIEGILNSPILNLINETIPGTTIIRAYHLENKFNLSFQERIDEYFKVLFYLNGTYQWYLMMLNFISFFFLVILLIFTLIHKELYSAKIIGIILSYSIIFQTDIIEFLSSFSNFENTMTKMERSLLYTNLINEKPQHLENDNINWPTKGEIEFVDYSTRYRPDTEIILKNLSFKIEGSKKIGIVGRTGSGKSTMALSLFRILEAIKGKIIIDGIDISTLGLKKIRNNLTILPQDSTIVEGTLRYNIDPVGIYNDNTIENIMKKIGFYYIIENNPNGLEQKVSENGNNLSIGEKQMICITRAILRKSKIIVMDEATSSIDYQTEETILKAIDDVLKDSTIITIAHRIKTIINYDKILVLDNGSIIEYDTPQNLLNNKNSEFYSLYEKSLV